MANRRELPWEKLYNFILHCGNVHEPYQFSVEILSGLREFCQFDLALVYFLDGNRKVRDQYLINISERWSNMYLEYYSKLNVDLYDVSREFFEPASKADVYIHDWTKEPTNEFVSDYIHAMGLKRTLGFGLFDLNRVPRTVFALDRLSDAPFTEQEIAILRHLVPQLNNLHKNFFMYPTNY